MSGAWVRRVEAWRTSRRARQGVYAGLALTVLADLVVPAEHALVGLAALPGFSALYGLLCSLLLLAGAWLGHAGLRRPEQYYD